MQDKFNSAMRDPFGTLGAHELSLLLEQEGIKPLPGILSGLLAETAGCEGKCARIGFAEYLRVDALIQSRGGILGDFEEPRAFFARCDPEGAGAVPPESVGAVLSLMNFVVDLAVVSEVIAQVGGPDCAALNELQFFNVLRRYRDREVDRAIEALLARGLQGSRVGAEALAGAFESLGYALASPDAVAEAGGQGPAECACVFEPVYTAFESVRKSYGFLEAELADLGVAFKTYEVGLSRLFSAASKAPPGEALATGPPSSCLVELWGAFRSLGHPLAVWTLQSLLDDLGLDGDGNLDHEGFLRLAAAIRRQELGQIREALGREALEAHGAAPHPEGTGAARALPAAKFRALLVRLGYPTLEGQVGEVPEHATLWEAERICKRRRAAMANAARANHGFGEAEVAHFRRNFLKFASEAGGSIKPKQVAKLLATLSPGATTSLEEHARVRAFLEAAVAAKDGEMHFPEFLLLMRLFSDDCERARLERERRAVQATQFSREEVNEFRAIFRSGLSSPRSHRMTVPDFVRMVARIVPVVEGNSRERELGELLKTIETNEAETYGFGEFLLAVHHLIRKNWHGINDKAANISAKTAGLPKDDEELP